MKQGSKNNRQSKIYPEDRPLNVEVDSSINILADKDDSHDKGKNSILSSKARRVLTCVVG